MFALAVSAVVMANSVTGNFTRYPAYSGSGYYSGIEVITDRGLIAELIVRCSTDVAILSYSKAEKLYCTPKDGCFDTLVVARRTACSR
ncbi:MAG: hypothetical protein ACRBCJ_09955 [Hyphomicrobiaceae bacterium]